MLLLRKKRLSNASMREADNIIRAGVNEILGPKNGQQLHGLEVGWDCQTGYWLEGANKISGSQKLSAVSLTGSWLGLPDRLLARHLPIRKCFIPACTGWLDLLIQFRKMGLPVLKLAIGG
jgi:hypothetical protein